MPITRVAGRPAGTGAAKATFTGLDFKTAGAGLGRRTYRASNWSKRGANTFASSSDYVIEVLAEQVQLNADSTTDGAVRIGCGRFRRSTEETFRQFTTALAEEGITPSAAFIASQDAMNTN